MSELIKADLRERLGNIDQIRDVLIGPQMRDYSNRLEQLERNSISLQQEVRTRCEEVRQTLLAELQTAIDSWEKKIRALILKDEEEKFDIRQQIDGINKRIASTTQDLQESITTELDELAENADKRFKAIQAKDEDDKFEIRQQIDLLSKRMMGNIEAIDKTLHQQTTTLQENLQETRTKLQDEITDLRNQILEELERYCSMLNQEKVSRDDMAELLFELGLRLKGREFVPELQQVANTAPETQTLEQTLLTPPSETVDDLEAKIVLDVPPPPAKSQSTISRRGRTGRLKGV
jgi:hypothetical protein